MLLLPGGVDDDLDRQAKFETIAAALIETGGVDLGLRVGTDQLVFPGGSSHTNETTFTHGLGRAPVAVLATVLTSGQGAVVAIHAGNYTTTTFKAMAEYVNGFAPGAGAPIDFVWLAIG